MVSKPQIRMEPADLRVPAGHGYSKWSYSAAPALDGILAQFSAEG